MVNWGSEKCVPPLPTDDRDADWRQHLVQWAGVVGLSSITDDNVEEWLWRMAFLGKTYAWEAEALAYPGKKGGHHEKVYVTLPVLRRWVGLWTNWSTLKRSQWVKLRMERITEDCDRRVARARHEETTA